MGLARKLKLTGDLCLDTDFGLCVWLTCAQVHMLKLIPHKAHVVGSRRGEGQETGQTNPLDASVTGCERRV